MPRARKRHEPDDDQVGKSQATTCFDHVRSLNCLPSSLSPCSCVMFSCFVFHLALPASLGSGLGNSSNSHLPQSIVTPGYDDTPHAQPNLDPDSGHDT
ncbi:hypothetical protein M378DRAFT_169777 [Amanita muscaria Koide BX008]|uniref:Uncharacterized protein n=1 Tax=Amanita muscaria (strain Koide BX008) TaxID=946122 RepID=A0A0C2WQW8_AMAMK|nr:hypothetical protein M378DRAFT_169777 [Amanita muscaria Koide BX008]